MTRYTWMHSGPLTADGATSRHAWERTWSIDRLVLRQIGRFASGGFSRSWSTDNWRRLVVEFTICSLERCWIEWSVSLRRHSVRINVVLVCRFVGNQALCIVSVFVGRRVASRCRLTIIVERDLSQVEQLCQLFWEKVEQDCPNITTSQLHVRQRLGCSLYRNEASWRYFEIETNCRIE